MNSKSRAIQAAAMKLIQMQNDRKMSYRIEDDEQGLTVRINFGDNRNERSDDRDKPELVI